ncbi:hypothetical protein C5O00_09765 [Pukyongia salina]|uniref:Sulfotransferase n=1 Tax=Pukyongia salina TaxID=2094025 RepID=A0A2S0HZ34_9FLAO|nr:hypothetical protein [Pukyongia salina]AVI51443.1 hypothetical protein C5O00_09765 [Pukyongia salina]
MRELEQKIIFLNSYSPRSGHNFVSEVFKIFSDHEVLIHNRSETRLSTLLKSYYEVYDRTISQQTDKEFMDHLFIDGLRERILEKSDRKYVMIKDTTFEGKDMLPRVFPHDIHVILLRDPKGVYNSLLKGMKFQKKGWKNLTKRLTFQLGIYPYYFCRKASGRVLKILPDLTRHKVVRYEDLHEKDEKTLGLLKELFSCDKSMAQINKEIDAIAVINTSFIKEVGAEKVWDMKQKSDRFDPVNRKGNPYLVRVAIRYGSRALRKKLNYLN